MVLGIKPQFAEHNSEKAESLGSAPRLTISVSANLGASFVLFKMGCGASKNSVAAPEPVTIEARPKLEPEPPQTSADEVKVPSSSEPAAAADSVPPSPTPSQKSTSSRISVRSKQNSNRPGSGKRKSSLRQKFEKLRHDGAEVTDSSEKEADESDRGLSAISKDSGYTADSEVGPIGDGPPSAVLEEESANPQVEAARACPSTPDLTLQGVAICSTKTSSATRRHPGSLPPLTPKSLKGAAKSSSTPVLPTDTPGIEDKLGPPTPSSGRSVSFADKVEVISPQIIERTSSRGGLAFDLQFTPDPGNIKRTPSRMMKLDSKRKCKSADVLRRELEERMQAAEARKKANEQILLQRLAANKNKEIKVQSSLKESVQSQSEKTESLLSHRMESTQENREAHLKALRDRLQAKKEHGEKVRQTKLSPLRPPPGPALAVTL